MPIRLKKLIGTILLVALVIVYALVASIVAVAQLAESGPLAHFAFFLLQRHALGPAGHGHHQMADAAAAAEELRFARRR